MLCDKAKKKSRTALKVCEQVTVATTRFLTMLIQQLFNKYSQFKALVYWQREKDTMNFTLTKDTQCRGKVFVKS